MKALIPVLAGSCLLAGCLVSPESSLVASSSGPRVEAALEGSEFPAGETRYDYVALDANGDRVVTGMLVLALPHDSPNGAIEGRWDLQGPPDPELGPQIGTGELAGVLHDGILAIDLNPFHSDFNVTLQGAFVDESRRAIRGAWSYSTIVGVVNGGSFAARVAR